MTNHSKFAALALTFSLLSPGAEASPPVVHCTSAITFAQVPVTDGTGSQWRTALFLAETNVQVGTVLSVHAEGQVRNNLGYNVEVAELLEVRRTVQKDCVGGVDVNCTGGTWKTVAGGTEQPLNINGAIIAGENLSPTEHYRKLNMSDTFVATIVEPVLYIVARTRSRSTGATTPPGNLDIQAGQWKMCVQRFNP